MKLVCRENSLNLELEGQERIWSLKKIILLDQTEITKMTWRNEKPNKKQLTGFRLPGTALPGVIFAGSFKKQYFWEFWYLLMRKSGYLVIETKLKRYKRIRVSVSKNDAEKAIIWFNSRLETRKVA